MISLTIRVCPTYIDKQEVPQDMTEAANGSEVLFREGERLLGSNLAYAEALAQLKPGDPNWTTEEQANNQERLVLHLPGHWGCLITDQGNLEWEVVRWRTVTNDNDTPYEIYAVPGATFASVHDAMHARYSS